MPEAPQKPDRRSALEGLRVELSARLAGAEDGVLPGLSRELRQVLAELDGLPSAEAKAPADEIQQRREKRRAAAAG